MHINTGYMDMGIYIEVFMKWIKFLSFVFLAAVMLLTVNSCGVPDPTLPAATAVPEDSATIKNSDSIVITFSASMNPGSLTLSGDMASESDGGVWSQAGQSNDTLTVRPGDANTVWTPGLHTLTVNVKGINEAPLPELTLNYIVEEPVPTAVVVPADSSTIIGSDLIVIIFSTTMNPSTLSLAGNMAAESKAGVWSTTTNTNDTLVIRPLTAWTSAADTLIIDVDSAKGVSLPTLTLSYTVDDSVPIAIAEPADAASINTSTPIVISFIESTMEPATLALTSTQASDGGIWSSNGNTNNTLTISPSGAWIDGGLTLTIDVEASNSIPLNTLTLNYIVDGTLPTASVTPATNSRITGGEPIVITFDESMDIDTLTIAGTASINDIGLAFWLEDSYINDQLVLAPNPQSAWPEGDISIQIEVADVVGNSLAPLSLNYIVDVVAPAGAADPVTGSILYGSDDIVISFSESMAPGSISYAGSLLTEVGTSIWSTAGNTNDTLTISPSTKWTAGAQTLDVLAEDEAGNLVVLNLVYDVPALCGDVITTAPEDCDTGGFDAVSCDGDCTLPVCGDSYTNSVFGEDCDDGGIDTASCNADCTSQACGDSYTNSVSGEACDDGGETAFCDADCTLPVCGDSYTNSVFGEACDAGGVDAVSCDSDCTLPACGDFYTNTAAGEECDTGGLDGFGVEGYCFGATCTLSICGDGIPNAADGETCDDGNTLDGDGCSSVCLIE